MKNRVLVAMSGGVDSSVAAYLLKHDGFEIVGATMCLGLGGDIDHPAVCCSAKAIEDARKVCRAVDCPHYVFDFAPELKQKVIDNFIGEYRAGRTPNPCVRCNQHLKFDTLLRKARGMGFDYLATGHYAKIEASPDGCVMKRPKDRNKDQTYFLYCIKKDDLSSVLFPLADLTKAEVRAIAREAGLPVAEKAESQDVCFIPDHDYAGFLQKVIPSAPGRIVDMHGKVLGYHHGIFNYTIGQRRGLGALGQRMFVKSIDPQTNTVVTATESDLTGSHVVIRDLNLGWLPLNAGDCCQVQIRYRSAAVDATVTQLSAGHMTFTFHQPVRAIAPGQAAVLYREDAVLGGGTIESGE